MSYLSYLVTSIAISDIDVAEEGLRALIDPKGEYYPTVLRLISEDMEIEPESGGSAGGGGSEPPDPLDWAHYICTYSRYIYLNVWKYRCSVERVKDVILILQSAKEQIERLIQECDLSQKDKSELKHYTENIELRINNLRDYK